MNDEECYFNELIELNSILKHNPNDADKFQDYQGALADYDRAIELNPNDAVSYGNAPRWRSL
jgi:tetratricopeptide (TPR) repeat protein